MDRSPPPSPLRVGLVLGRDAGYGVAMQSGVQRYAATRSRWVFRAGRTPGPLYDWGCRGIIAMVAQPELYPSAKTAECPVVNVSNRLADTGLPTVHADDIAVGRIAADHLLGLGLRHFGFAGPADCHFATQREAGYTAALAGAGFTPDVLDRSDLRDPTQFRERDAMFARWLARLPRPMGIFCAEDSTAERLLNVCLEQDIRVPDEMAVLGANNDALMCEALYPPLSSVDIPFEQIGFEAAGILEALLAGGAAPTQPLLIPPRTVAARRSTQVLAPDNPLLARVLSVMIDHHAEELNVADIAQYVGISRRHLEQMFARSLNTTPARHLEKIRIDHARKLLADTDLSMPDVAAATGYGNQTRMGVAFRRTNDMTPTAYRRQFRLRKG